jgi:hypothetical protein
MGDPNKNPNIYGTDAHRDRVVRDVENAKRGWGTPSTRQGWDEVHRQEQEKKRWEAQPPVFVPAPAPLAYPPARHIPTSEPRSRRQRTKARSRNSQPFLMNLACALVGLLAVVYVGAHGMKSGLALATAFAVAFVGSRLVISHMKLLIGIALLGFLLYEIVHALAGH